MGSTPDFGPGIFEEPVGVQTLVMKASFEGLEKRIVRRLTGTENLKVTPFS
jgi:hypothetical protein